MESLDSRSEHTVSFEKPKHTRWLSPSFDLYDGRYCKSAAECLPVLKEAQKELAALDTSRDLYSEALEAFRVEQQRGPGELPPYLKEMKEGGYQPSIEDTAFVYRGDEEWIAQWMAGQIRDRCDPRTPEFLERYFKESNRRIQEYIKEKEVDAEGGEPGDTWTWRGPPGAWREVRVKQARSWGDSGRAARRREFERAELDLWRDVNQYWGLNGEGPHNEGILRDHPKHQELFKKWATRYLKLFGPSLDPERYSGKVSADGYLLDHDGYRLERLEGKVSRGRDVIDSAIREELMVTEGFIDITNNPERQEELGIYPQHGL